MAERNILFLLEQTPSGQVAAQIAWQLASKHGSFLTGLEIAEPPIDDEDEDHKRPTGVEVPHVPKPATFSKEGVPYEHKRVMGPKYAALSQEAEKNDLTVIGREGNFEEEADGAKEVITLMLEYRARPLLIAPPTAADTENNEVLIAYDGSPRASRALYFFTFLGLTEGRKLNLLTIDRSTKAAEAKLNSVCSFLEHHEIEAEKIVVQSRENTTEVLSEQIEQLKPGMVVAGAAGKQVWREAIFGTVGAYLIRRCTTPLFTCS